MAERLKSWLRPRRKDPRKEAGPAPYRLLTPELERRLAGLRFNFTHSMSGRLTGVHRSAQPGVSVEFSDHKEYSPGDDIRRLNWKVYARSDKFYIRQFAKDTHANVHLLLDRSASMTYQSSHAPVTKAFYAARLAAILSYIFLRQNDAVGLLTVRGARMEHYIPARSHPSQLIAMQEYLEETLAGAEPPEATEGPTSMAESLEYLVALRLHQSAVIVLTDLFLQEEELFPYLAYLKSAGNFVWLIQVLDPAEFDFGAGDGNRTFPFEGNMLFRSLEARHGILMDSRLARGEYVAKFLAWLEAGQHRCAEYGIELSRCNTDWDPATFVLEYLLGRR